MTLRKSLSGRFIRMCALTLMVSACSTVHSLSPADMSPSIPGNLLVHPQDPPKVQRSTNAAGQVVMTGGDATSSMTTLYDYIGSIKGQLDGLINAVVARDQPPPPKKHHKLF